MYSLIERAKLEIESIKKKKKNAPHPIEVALRFHLDYVSIHPFYDGNGRTARIISNLLLISFGYPPFWIKTDEKNIYYQYLGDIQSYGGKPNLFFEFCCNLIIRSQQLMLDAIEGINIDEPDDLDKKLSILEKELDVVESDEEVKKFFQREVFFEIYKTWFSELVKELLPVIQKFNKLFTGIRHTVSIDHGIANFTFTNESAEEVLKKVLEIAEKNVIQQFNNQDCKIYLQFSFGTLIKGGLKTFPTHFAIIIRFDPIKYEITLDEVRESGERNQVIVVEQLLHKRLNPPKIKEIVRSFGDSLFNHIDYYTKKYGIR
jgi:hypothetical protein